MALLFASVIFFFFFCSEKSLTAVFMPKIFEYFGRQAVKSTTIKTKL